MNPLPASGRMGFYTFSVDEDCIGEPTCSLDDYSGPSAKKVSLPSAWALRWAWALALRSTALFLVFLSVF